MCQFGRNETTSKDGANLELHEQINGVVRLNVDWESIADGRDRCTVQSPRFMDIDRRETDSLRRVELADNQVTAVAAGRSSSINVGIGEGFHIFCSLVRGRSPNGITRRTIDAASKEISTLRFLMGLEGTPFHSG